MKEKLLAGEATFGVSVMIPSPQIVEMVGRLGFDWVLLDCEHGAISRETVESMAMAAEASGITPIARPSANTPEAILEVLDRGALGVQVPHVNTAAEARRAVEAARYHPLGRRGLAAGTRAAAYGYGESMDRYVKRTNRETLVCVQLEEEEAIRNADEILQVEGVDVFFIGPSDLSQSMGHPGDPGAPAVSRAIEDTFAKIVDAGRIAGCAGGIEAIRSYRRQGVNYLYTHLPRLLSSASERFLEAVRE